MVLNFLTREDHFFFQLQVSCRLSLLYDNIAVPQTLKCLLRPVVDTHYHTDNSFWATWHRNLGATVINSWDFIQQTVPGFRKKEEKEIRVRCKKKKKRNEHMEELARQDLSRHYRRQPRGRRNTSYSTPVITPGIGFVYHLGAIHFPHPPVMFLQGGYHPTGTIMW